MAEFARCYECGLIYPPADMEGGLCRSCQGEPSQFTFETIGGLVKGRCSEAKEKPMFGCDCDPEKPATFKCDHDEGPLFAGVLKTDIGPIYSFPPGTGTYGQRKAKRMREAKAAKKLAAVDASVIIERR
jgi:hypothetical protein